MLLFLCAAAQAQTYSLGWGYVASGGGQGTAGSYTESGSIALAGVSYAVSGTVQGPPQITTQPQSLSVAAGSNCSLSITASGVEPLAYHWRKDGLPGSLRRRAAKSASVQSRRASS